MTTSNDSMFDSQAELGEPRVSPASPAFQEEFQPPLIPPDLSPEQEYAFKRKHFYAFALQHHISSDYLQAILTEAIGTGPPREGLQEYLKNVLQQAGGASDPIERIIVEQILMMHHSVGRLHIKAASSATHDQDKVYSERATALTAELRRWILALPQYREKSRAKSGEQSTQPQAPQEQVAGKPQPAVDKQPAMPQKQAAMTPVQAASAGVPTQVASLPATKLAEGKAKRSQVTKPPKAVSGPVSRVPQPRWESESRPEPKPTRKGTGARTKRGASSPAKKPAREPDMSVVSYPRKRSDLSSTRDRSRRKPK